MTLSPPQGPIYRVRRPPTMNFPGRRATILLTSSPLQVALNTRAPLNAYLHSYNNASLQPSHGNRCSETVIHFSSINAACPTDRNSSSSLIKKGPQKNSTYILHKAPLNKS